VWQKTQYSNLLRYVPSGTYFARIRVGGKLIRRSLESFSIAKLKLADLEKSGLALLLQLLGRVCQLKRTASRVYFGSSAKMLGAGMAPNSCRKMKLIQLRKGSASRQPLREFQTLDHLSRFRVRRSAVPAGAEALSHVQRTPQIPRSGGAMRPPPFAMLQ